MSKTSHLGYSVTLKPESAAPEQPKVKLKPEKYLWLDHEWIEVTSMGDRPTVVCSRCGQQRTVICRNDSEDQWDDED